MKNSTFLAYVLLVLTFCLPTSTSAQQSESDTLEFIQQQWINGLNYSAGLSSFYSKNSGILLNGELYIGSSEISKQLEILKGKIGEFHNYKVIGEYQIRKNQKFVMGRYQTKDHNIYSSIIGWRKQGTWIKEFETIYEINDDYFLEIDKVEIARKNWEKYSNLHRPDLIVENVFSKNGKYFYRGTASKTEKISQAYSYMTNESYSITLDPLKVLQVNDHIIFDVGTFQAGGKGLYTLIWVKEEHEWKLLLDFNF